MQTLDLIEKIQGQEHLPVIQEELEEGESIAEKAVEPSQNPQTVRHKIWRFLHTLQGFEGRYALRVVAVTGCLAIPAYFSSARGWWNTYDSWWAVCMAWIMSHTM